MSRRKSPLLSNSPFHGIAANLSHLLGGNHLQHCTYRPFSWHTEATNTDLAVRSSPHMLNEKDGESNWKVRSVMKSKRSEKFRCDTSPVAQLNYLLSMGNQVCGKINYESSSWWGIEGGGGVEATFPPIVGWLIPAAIFEHKNRIHLLQKSGFDNATTL